MPFASHTAIGNLLGYLTGVSRWIAVLEVTSEPYQNTSDRIWQQAVFPCRVNVKIIAALTPETGIPTLSLAKQLRLFESLTQPNWGVLFKTAPRELHATDGELITKLVIEVSKKEQ